MTMMDIHTQVSVYWADHLLLLRSLHTPPRLPPCASASTVQVAVSTVLCRWAVATLLGLYHFRMKTYASSSFRRTFLPTFCSTFPPFLELGAERLEVLLVVLNPAPLLSPGIVRTAGHSPNFRHFDRGSCPMYATKPTNSIRGLRTFASALSEPELRTAQRAASC